MSSRDLDRDANFVDMQQIDFFGILSIALMYLAVMGEIRTIFHVSQYLHRYMSTCTREAISAL